MSSAEKDSDFGLPAADGELVNHIKKGEHQEWLLDASSY